MALGSLSQWAPAHSHLVRTNMKVKNAPSPLPVCLCQTTPRCGVPSVFVELAAAFFLSIEFQQTGYLVYRMYKTPYGNLTGAPVPLGLNEFLPDTQQIGQGVIVGQTWW